ncbi:hypothetical protein CNBG_9470 [Cryptococcus deuterogattii R265]|uniref:uncharacterized protein n=1 Tax=Cryptococcus deuterogattii (strain R265) TaxID=294750 RepID=UPI0019352558|nr:hypothetical protein CNBG_9470 [Cryptococcus deuterogattii R265]
MTFASETHIHNKNIKEKRMSPTQYTASGCSVGSGNGDGIRSPTTPSPRRTRTSRPCTICRSKKIKCVPSIECDQ